MAEIDLKTLVKELEPVLVFAKDERFYPVTPESFIKKSSLWLSRPPEDEEQYWKLQLEAETISLSEDGGENYLGKEIDTLTGPSHPYLYSDEMMELFFNFGGWERRTVLIPAGEGEFEEEEVGPDKSAPRLDEVATTYNTDFKDELYHYYAELVPMSTIIEMLATFVSDDPEQGAIPSNLMELLGMQFINYRALIYHFFYPAHEGGMGVFDFAGLEAHEGDWQAVAVLFKEEKTEPEKGEEGIDYFQFKEDEKTCFLIPKFGVYSRFGCMVLKSWREIPKVKNHLVSYVSLGTHNNYPYPGPKDVHRCDQLDKDININDIIGEEIPEAVKDEVDAAVDNFSNEVKRKVSKYGMLIAMGLISGGLLGGLIGAGIAALIDALDDSDSDSSSDDGQPYGQGMDMPPDVEEDPGTGEETVIAGRVIAPEAIIDSLNGNEQLNISDEIVPWKESGLINEDAPGQIFWKYQGRWGTRVTDDPFGLRPGPKYNNYHAALGLGIVADLLT